MHQEENHVEEKINFCLCNSVNYCAKQPFLGSGNNTMIGRIMPHPRPHQTNKQNPNVHIPILRTCEYVGSNSKEELQLHMIDTHNQQT